MGGCVEGGGSWLDNLLPPKLLTAIADCSLFPIRLLFILFSILSSLILRINLT